MSEKSYITIKSHTSNKGTYFFGDQRENVTILHLIYYYNCMDRMYNNK